MYIYYYFSLIAMSLLLILNNKNTLVHAEPGLVGSCKNSTINVVNPFDIGRYLGQWYEIGHSESFKFDTGCAETTAIYTKTDDPNVVQVNNTCYKKGEYTTAIGKAYYSNSAHLKVSFYGPFTGPYDVLYVDNNYEIALVVSCSKIGGSNLWLLSRYKMMDDKTFNYYVEKFRLEGFDTGDFVKTSQTMKIRSNF